MPGAPRRSGACPRRSAPRPRRRDAAGARRCGRGRAAAAPCAPPSGWRRRSRTAAIPAAWSRVPAAAASRSRTPIGRWRPRRFRPYASTATADVAGLAHGRGDGDQRPGRLPWRPLSRDTPTARPAVAATKRTLYLAASPARPANAGDRHRPQAIGVDRARLGIAAWCDARRRRQHGDAVGAEQAAHAGADLGGGAAGFVGAQRADRPRDLPAGLDRRSETRLHALDPVAVSAPALPRRQGRVDAAPGFLRRVAAGARAARHQMPGGRELADDSASSGAANAGSASTQASSRTISCRGTNPRLGQQDLRRRERRRRRREPARSRYRTPAPAAPGRASSIHSPRGAQAPERCAVAGLASRVDPPCVGRLSGEVDQPRRHRRRRKPLDEPPGTRSGAAGLSGVP